MTSNKVYKTKPGINPVTQGEPQPRLWVAVPDALLLRPEADGGAAPVVHLHGQRQVPVRIRVPRRSGIYIYIYIYSSNQSIFSSVSFLPGVAASKDADASEVITIMLPPAGKTIFSAPTRGFFPFFFPSFKVPYPPAASSHAQLAIYFPC